MIDMYNYVATVCTARGSLKFLVKKIYRHLVFQLHVHVNINVRVLYGLDCTAGYTKTDRFGNNKLCHIR